MQEAERVRWDIQGTVDYILRGQHHTVALQFPDELLERSHVVHHELAAALKRSGRPEVEVCTVAHSVASC